MSFLPRLHIWLLKSSLARILVLLVTSDVFNHWQSPIKKLFIMIILTVSDSSGPQNMSGTTWNINPSLHKFPSGAQRFF